MRKLARLFHVGVLLATVSFPAAVAAGETVDRVTVIYAGTLLVTPGQAPLERQTVIVEGGKVREIRPGFVAKEALPADSDFIDLSRAFVLPGLMDMHAHVTMRLDQPRPVRLSQEFLMTPAAVALRASADLRNILDQGFTTVRDLGGAPDVIFPLKDAVASGEVPGPRIFAAGQLLSVTAGHGDNPFILERYRSMASEDVQTCDGADDCRRKTRERLLRGADVIKIATSASGSDDRGGPNGRSDMFSDELQAIVETASLHGVPVAAHVTATRAINFSIENGVKTIEHGTYADQSSFQLLKARGAILVPTTYVVDFLDRPEIEKGLRPEEWRALSAALKAARLLPGAAYRAGVKMALATDSGGESSARRWRELALYVESGVPAGEAIKAATVNAAEVIGMQDRLGQLRQGYLADIIATCGDPLRDINVLSKVDFVMKEGRAIRGTGRGAICH